MKKVVCPVCGLVNLERFVTYPHCAACGAALAGVVEAALPAWKRPLSAPIWATVIGLCCAALGIAGIVTARETRPDENGVLLVYVQTPRQLPPGQIGSIRLGLDAVEASAGARADFEDLQVRLPAEVFVNFDLIAISPPPIGQIARRNGLYLEFGRLPRDQNIILSLRAKRPGLHRFGFSLYARDFPPLQWRTRLKAAPFAPLSRSKSAPNAPRPPRPTPTVR